MSTTTDYPLTMASVCACVQTRFGGRGKTSRLLTPRFFSALDDFEDAAVDAVIARGQQRGKAGTLLKAVVHWCTTVTGEGITPETTKFLSAKKTQVFVWLMVLPEAWLCDPSESKLYQVIDPWFVALRVEPGSPTYMGALATMRSISREIREKPERLAFCASALHYIVSESTRIKHLRGLDATISRIGFPLVVPSTLRFKLVLAVRLMGDSQSVKIPGWMMPPLAMTDTTEDVFNANILVLIEKVVGGQGQGRWTTRPECVDEFEMAVFGGRGIYAFETVLRQALVFVLCPEWADEWKARGWPTTTRTQRGLARLHVSGWKFRPKDIVDLILS